MGARSKDPTEPMRLKASRYAGVVRGTSCTQSSFKTATSAFFYVGKQGGRFKAMFKLRASRPEADRLARAHPDDYQVGLTGWVTARFTAAQPMPPERWRAWLDESYALANPRKSGGGQPRGRARRGPERA